MDYVNCNGSEPKLWRSCSHFTHYYGCSHSSEVGVRCQPGKSAVMCEWVIYIVGVKGWDTYTVLLTPEVQIHALYGMCIAYVSPN